MFVTIYEQPRLMGFSQFINWHNLLCLVKIYEFSKFMDLQNLWFLKFTRLPRLSVYIKSQKWGKQFTSEFFIPS